jgi:hypothetical protein
MLTVITSAVCTAAVQDIQQLRKAEECVCLSIMRCICRHLGYAVHIVTETLAMCEQCSYYAPASMLTT